MKRYTLLLLLACCLVNTVNAYVVYTTDMTPFIFNSNFTSGLSGWYVLSSTGLTDVETTTAFGSPAIVLNSFYQNTTVKAAATIQTWDGNGTTSNYHAIDFSTSFSVVGNTTTYTPYVQDGIVVKVWAMGALTTANTVSGGTVTGTFSILLQNALSFPTSNTAQIDPTVMAEPTQYITNDQFHAISNDSVFGMMTSWTVFSFNFTPSGQCDWWQIRDLYLSYVAAPNQPFPTGLVIGKIELFVLRVDDQ